MLNRVSGPVLMALLILGAAAIAPLAGAHPVLAVGLGLVWALAILTLGCRPATSSSPRPRPTCSCPPHPGRLGPER
jgi:hypothetical protein